MTRGLKTFYLAEEELSFNMVSWGRANGYKGIGSEDRHQLLNSLKKYLHIFAVGLREFRPTQLTIHHLRPSGCLRLLNKSTFQVANMCLGQVFVFTDKEKDVIPKIFVKVDPQAITDTFSFADVNGGFSGFRICPTQEINTRFSSFLARD